jgi:hypothetical protein
MEYEKKDVDLEQFDYVAAEVIEDVEDELAPLIGFFLINFSLIEDALNTAIAEIVNGRSNEPGYFVVEKLGFYDKIELFFKFYLRIVSFQEGNGKDDLILIRDRLKDINTFRNIVAHANWTTIDEDGFVRTKIKIGGEEGNVTFTHVKITLEMFKTQIEEIDSLEEALNTFSEKALRFGYEERLEEQD